MPVTGPVVTHCHIDTVTVSVSGASIWDPHTQSNILKIEKVNKRAARFVTGNYTMEHGQSEKNLSLLNWPTLQETRQHHKLTLMYKIKENIIHAPTDDLQPNPRKPLNFQVPQSSVNAHLHSFYPSTIRLWNQQPHTTKTSTSLTTFSAALKKNLAPTPTDTHTIQQP